MKAELSKDGNLKIIAENGCEEYALDSWWDGYFKDESSPESIQIVSGHEETE
jgi:hypothetical protein